MPDLDQIKQGEQASARPARGRSFKPATIEDAMKAGSFLAGRPEDIIEALKAVERRYPMGEAKRKRPFRRSPPLTASAFANPILHGGRGRAGPEDWEPEITILSANRDSQ